MYRPGYDDLNRSILVETETGRRKYVQKGYTEPLLCRDCEQFLNNRYEDPFAEAWYNRGLVSDPPTGTEMAEMSGINYGPFELFHLSILWRASVGRGESLEPADLGPHEAPIRQMILNDDPGEAHEYPVIGIALTHEGDLAHGLIMGPAMWKYDAMRMYTFICGGFEWAVGVASHCPRGIRRMALKKDGTMRVPVRAWQDSPFVQKGLRQNAARRAERAD